MKRKLEYRKSLIKAVYIISVMGKTDFSEADLNVLTRTMLVSFNRFYRLFYLFNLCFLFVLAGLASAGLGTTDS
jgi:hypothetical protein